jgi:threonylcarbamoyladenosine tRNA methylthiotransferase MtaB
VVFITFGCRSNQYDTSAMMAELDPERFNISDQGQTAGSGEIKEAADIYVINTCTVTHRSDFQSRQMVRRVKRCNPGAMVIVTGCLVETNPGSLEGLPYDHLVRPGERGKVARIIMDGEASGSAEGRGFYYHPEGGLQHRTRAVVKVQDGCDLRCAFCTVPLARGRSRSLEPERVMHQLRVLHGKGFREAVLTGINLGAYGRDIGTSLLKLLKLIEDDDQLPERIRISSLEPHEINPGLIKHLAGARRICPHLHLALQSGDDMILARMRRGYRSDEFSSLVRELHDAMPGLCLGMDVIAGFPGETDENFENTLRVLEGLPFAYLHVFPFSRRPGTEAWEFKDTVPADVIKYRAGILRRLGQERRMRFHRDHEGSILRVLVERHEAMSGGDSGMLRGLSDNYIPVQAAGSKQLTGRIIKIKAEKATGQGIVGSIKH